MPSDTIGFFVDNQLADQQMKGSAHPSSALKIVAIVLLVFLPQPLTADDISRIYSFGGLDLLGQSPHYVEVGVGVFDVLERKSTSRRSAAGRVVGAPAAATSGH